MEDKLIVELQQMMSKINAMPNLKVISCTEAGELIGKTKLEIRQLVDQKQLTNYGNEYRYMVSKEEALSLVK